MKAYLMSLLTATLLVCGCSTTASRQTFQASRTGRGEPGTYFFVTDEVAQNQPLQTQRVLACVDAALATHGFTRSADPSSALQVNCEFGTDLDHVAIEIWEKPVVRRYTAYRFVNGQWVPDRARKIGSVPVEIRVPHYRALIFLSAHRAGEPFSGWCVFAEIVVPEDDISGVWPSLVAAAASLLAPDAPSESTITLGPDDPFVRAIAAGSAR